MTEPSSELEEKRFDRLLAASSLGTAESRFYQAQGEAGNYGINRYVSADAIVEALGEAHALLGDGLWDSGILGGELEKTIRRALKGWAEQRERPTFWPWTHRAFDDFPWLR